MLHHKYYLHNLLCAWLKRVRFMISLLVECRKKSNRHRWHRPNETEKKIERATQKCGRGNRDINNECMNEQQKSNSNENNTGSLNHLNYEPERSGGGSSSSGSSTEKKRNVLLSDDCYNLIMYWTLIVRNIINGNWMMSWDCNTSQSIFNAGMSFRYVAVVFFFRGGSLCV